MKSKRENVVFRFFGFCQKANSGRPGSELAPIFGNVSRFHKGWKVRVGFVFTQKKTRKRGLKRWTTKKDTNNKNEGREKRQICKKFEKTFFYKTQVSVSRVFIGVCVRPLLMDEYQFRGIDMPISYRIKKSCIAPYWYLSPINTAIKKVFVLRPIWKSVSGLRGCRTTIPYMELSCRGRALVQCCSAPLSQDTNEEWGLASASADTKGHACGESAVETAPCCRNSSPFCWISTHQSTAYSEALFIFERSHIFVLCPL